MSELKTLKDLIEEDKTIIEDVWVDSNKLKAEAIKWVKELRKNFAIHQKDNFCHIKTGELDLNFFDYEQNDFDPIIRFVKHFFNITEEELNSEDKN